MSSFECRASIDLGSNTCLLLVQEQQSGSWVTLHDESRIVRLGEGLALTGQLSEAAIKRAKAALSDYVQIVKKFKLNPDQVVAVATAQARQSKNAEAFFNQIQNEMGFCFRTLSGEEEAFATYQGAISGLASSGSSSIMVMDIGGGSTELVFQGQGVSFDLGAVRITDLFLRSNPVTDAEFWSAKEYIDEMITRGMPETLIKVAQHSSLQFVAVAGTAVTLAMLQLGSDQYQVSEIEQAVLTQGDLHRFVEELKFRTIEERQAMAGMEAKRAEVMLGGALIFWRVMNALKINEARVSTRGLRYGVFDLKLD